jgi:hypothetical protein
MVCTSRLDFSQSELLVEERGSLDILQSVERYRDEVVGQNLEVGLVDSPRQFQHLAQVDQSLRVVLLRDVDLGDVLVGY